MTDRAATEAASDFIAVVLKLTSRPDYPGTDSFIWGSPESAAVRRASMDLTRTLAAMRRAG